MIFLKYRIYTRTAVTTMMMKRMLIFICLIASIGSTVAEVQFGGKNDPDWSTPVDCKTDEHCCLKSAAGGCAECCPNKLHIPMKHPLERDDINKMNERKGRIEDRIRVNYITQKCNPSMSCLRCVANWIAEEFLVKVLFDKFPHLKKQWTNRDVRITEKCIPHPQCMRCAANWFAERFLVKGWFYETV